MLVTIAVIPVGKEKMNCPSCLKNKNETNAGIAHMCRDLALKHYAAR